MINLDGAVVIVTGSASGTGAATALCLAGKGANVVVNYSRSKEKAEEVANSCSQLGGEVLVQKADVAKDEDCRLLAKVSLDQWGKIDGLVNNAINDIVVDQDGDIWCATSQGVGRYNGSSWQTYEGNGDLIARGVSRIAKSPDGSLWFATARGASRYASGKWTSFSTADGLAGNNIMFGFLNSRNTNVFF